MIVSKKVRSWKNLSIYYLSRLKFVINVTILCTSLTCVVMTIMMMLCFVRNNNQQENVIGVAAVLVEPKGRLIREVVSGEKKRS
jgi:hypothetical protein